MKRWSTRGLGRLPGSLAVWLFVAFDIALLVFLVVSSVKPTKEIFAAPWALPSEANWANWERAWSASGFGQASLNTLVLVGAASVTVLIVSAPAAYMLSRSRRRSSSMLTVFFALGLGIPAQVTVIPMFVMMAQVELVDSLFGLYLLYTGTHIPFSVFLLTGFFRTLPGELEEAAALDGASLLRSFWQIMLPLARSGLVTIFALNVISLWNETLLALVFLQSDEKYTLSLALLGFMASMQYSGADYGALFAGVCIIVLPMLVLYAWLSRRIIEGMTLGAGR